MRQPAASSAGSFSATLTSVSALDAPNIPREGVGAALLHPALVAAEVDVPDSLQIPAASTTSRPLYRRWSVVSWRDDAGGASKASLLPTGVADSAAEDAGGPSARGACTIAWDREEISGEGAPGTSNGDVSTLSSTAGLLLPRGVGTPPTRR